MSDLLNPPQRDATAHVDGPLLVFAGAGSGKTRVITYRIANLIATHGIAPYRILAVTFTNKAAGEMRSRLAGILGEDLARDLWVGTFHSTCAKWLRRHGEAIGVRQNFVIYDATDQKTLVTRVLKDLDLDERRYPPRAVLGRIQKEKQEGRGPDAMVLASYLDEGIQRAYAKFEVALAKANALDFEDLIKKTVELLESDHPEGRILRSKFDHVLVDEFQDTNAIQYRLIRALARDRRNLCVVGDDDQSIYRWRGADIRNIRGFQKDYPDAVVVKLEQNYRSSATIVRAALSVIERASVREHKALWTEQGLGLPITVAALEDERAEGAFIAARLMDAARQGIDLSEVAVFYRVHAQSRVIEESLRAANIRYQIIGGMRFYERAEVKDILSYFRLVENPDSDVDFLRVVNTPTRGIGSTTIERLAAFCRDSGHSMWEALEKHSSDITTIPAASKKKLFAFHAMVKKWRQNVLQQLPSELFDCVVTDSGYRASLEADPSVEAEGRLENLAELRSSLSDYEQEAQARGESPGLQGFLERVTLQSAVDTAEDGAIVTLMTVHGAKGLEFDLVFLSGMEEDMFPYRGMSDRASFDTDELDEERRLAYVAITRARKKLCISYAKSRQIFGTTRWGIPSRFLTDIPEELLELVGTPRPSYRAPAVRDIDVEDVDYSQAYARPAQSPPPPGRFVDTSYFDDSASESPSPWRKGMRVFHNRFGEGEVRKLVELGEPAVVAFFPGWGEMKVLARFLRSP